MTEVILEQVIVQNDAVNVLFQDNGLLFGDIESLETYSASLQYDEYLKHIFLNLIVILGETAVVGKTLIYNPNALDGVIVKLV
jgi:hypothetical protein